MNFPDAFARDLAADNAAAIVNCLGPDAARALIRNRRARAQAYAASGSRMMAAAINAFADQIAAALPSSDQA